MKLLEKVFVIFVNDNLNYDPKNGVTKVLEKKVTIEVLSF